MWNERYSSPGYAYGTEPNDFLAAVATRIPPGRVLSIADGEGRNGVFLATLGYDVTSVDASSVGLAKAQGLAAERGVRIATVVADLADYVISPGSWQGIVSIFCHLPPALRRRVHEQVVRGLAPDGVYVLEAYSVQQLRHGTGGPTSTELLPTLEALRAELAGLDLLHAVEIERDIHEGALHHGPSAVVQVLARKPAG
jgi:SAM-dependent methyltransferase